jgi:hypothetical protein
VNNSALAHDATTDSVEPAQIGKRFQFPEYVNRPFCNSESDIRKIMADIKRNSSGHAHHLLFHLSYNPKMKSGNARVKSGISRKVVNDVLRPNCKGTGGETSVTVTGLIEEVYVRDYKVAIISVWGIFKGGNKDYYTWLVNTEVREEAKPLSADERSAMIRNMVADLASRLERDGGTVEEWARLIRSHVVLGDKDKAQSYLLSAQDKFKQDSAALIDLSGLAKSLGL